MAKAYQFRVTSEGVEELKKQLEELGPVGDAAFKKLVDASPSLANAFERAQGAVDKFKKTAADGQGGGFLKLLAESADSLTQRASGLIGALGPVGEILTKLGPVGVTAAIGIGGIVTVMTMANKAAEEQARQFRQIDAVLKATGNQSGLTRQEIVAMAEAIEQGTMASGAAALDAAGALATFRGIGTATFGDVLKRAQDMSAVFGGDLKANTLDIGKALQKIASGDVEGLRRSFGFLGAAALGSVEDLARAGKTAEAQAKFMAALQASIGGTAEAERGNTLTGAVKGLGDAWDDFLKTVGKTDGAMKKAVDAAAGGVRAITEGLKAPPPDSRFVRPQGGADADEFDTLRRQLDRGPGTAMTQQGEASWRKALEKRLQDLSDKGRAAGGVTDAEAQAMNDREAKRFALAGQSQAAAADAAAADKARAESADKIVKSLERETELLDLGAKSREQQVAADKAEAQYREANKNSSEAELAAGIARVRAAAEANAIRKQDLDLAREIAKSDAEAAAQQDRDRAAAQKRADDILAADAARNRRTEDYIKGLEQAAAMQGLSSAEMKVQEALLKAQNGLLDEQGHRLRDLTDEEKNRVRAAVETTEAMEAQKKAAEAQQKELERIAGRSTDRIVDFGADFLDRIADKSKRKWTDIWDFVKDSGRKAFAQLAAEAVIRPIVQPVMTGVVNAVFGGGGLSGIGSLSGIGAGSGSPSGGSSSVSNSSGFSFGNLSSLFSLGSNSGLIGETFSLQNILSSLGIGGGAAAGGVGLSAAAGALPASEIFAGLPGVGAGVAGSSLMSILGGAGAGFAAGTLLNSLLGGNQTGGMVGSGVGALGGAVIGSLVPGIGTLIGGLIGGAAGGGLGGLFGPGKSVGPNGNATISVDASGFRVGSSGADNGGSAAGSIANVQQAADALNTLVKTYELTIDSSRVGSSGQANGYGFGVYGVDSGIGPSAKSGEELLLNIVRAGGVSGAGTVGTILRNSRAGSAAELDKDLQLAAVIDGLDASTKPLAAALKAVNDNFDDLTKRATDLGIATDKVAAAREREIASATAAVASQQLGGIAGLIKTLTIGGNSPLAAGQQLALARSSFEGVAAAALGGDAAALSNFAGVAATFLDVSRGFNATNADFTRDLGAVLDKARALVVDQVGGESAAQAILLSGAKTNQILEDILDGIDKLNQQFGRAAVVPRVAA